VTEIAVRCEHASDELVIIVKDNGVGIAPEEKEKIFEKGYGKNTGFGLFLAREILAITGITIRKTGYAGVGARFEITVPREMWRNAPGP
jgi:signal transduction histidine kinase